MRKSILIVWIALVGAASSGSANATTFFMDDFIVYSCGGIDFLDAFNDGIPPPSGDGSFVYGTVGNQVESGGKLILDTLQGDVRISPVTGNELYVQRSRLLTPPANDLDIPALQSDDYIFTAGVFDFIAPEIHTERYSVRFTDFGQPVPSDNVEVGVFRTSSGNLSIQFRQADFENSTLNVLASYDLAGSLFHDYDQVALGLWSDPNDNSVHAGFELYDQDGGLGNLFHEFSATGTIFRGENWTRAGFIAAVQTSAVPVTEPDSLALFGLVLAGLGLLGRRTNRK